MHRERLVPGDLAPASPPRPAQRTGAAQPVGIVLELGERSALRAEEAVGEHVVAVAADEHELVALEVELEPAGRLAQRAGPVRDASSHARNARTPAGRPRTT